MLTGGASAAEVILAHGNPPAPNPRGLGADMFGELLASCTKGAITVNVAHSATMGDDVELLTSTAAGVIQLTPNSQGATGQIIPEINVIGLPFLFDDAPTAWRVLDGEVGKMLDEKAQAAGLKILGFWDNGIRHVSHLNKAIKSPEDLKGVKIRTPPDDMTLAIFRAFGANPAPLAWSELPSALQSGVFEAQENPLSNTYSAKIHEITPQITFTAHKYEAAPFFANLAWYSGLSDTDRACVDEAALGATWYQRGASLRTSTSLIEPMKAEGVTFTDIADRQPFVDATKAVYDDYASRMPDLVAKLRQVTGK
ncbi:TRAP transporter substrate-binding protein [Aminobacter aminovorans]|nr:TRAP transporter substrate-binding protein [Aminobacter aminovorans]MBB3708893.1 tripartite ATP-independent transporter DctP family solute receptor [Aminobacter aminovorans]